MPEEDVKAPASKPERNAGDSFISKKLGPFPVWAWAVIAAAAVGVLIIVRKQQAGSQASASATGTPTAGDLANMGGAVGVTSADPLSLAALTEQIQGLTQQLKAGVPAQTQAAGPVQPQNVVAALPKPPPAPIDFGSLTTLSGIRFGELPSQPGTPLYDAAGNLTGQFIPRGQNLQVLAAPDYAQGGVLYKTAQGYINSLDVLGYTPGASTPGGGSAMASTTQAPPAGAQ